MKNLLVFLFVPAVLLLTAPPAARAQDEYPVAFWGQKHVKEALLLHRFLSPTDFRASCRNGELDLSRTARHPENLHKAWKDFSRKTARLDYCRSQPGKTWYLLGESPYFMLPENPGSHK